jgi:hypothetical protein
MSLIPKEDLERLAQTHDGWCVSIYLPTHRASNEIEQDPIRLKNLVDEAEERLLAEGLSEGDVGKFLDPIREQLPPQATFWQNNLDGLCIFRSSETLDMYRLPFSFEPLTVVAHNFHVKPLLPILSGNGQFYLMTLHKDGIHLYQGTRASLARVVLEDVPEGVEDMLIDRDQERPQQWHTDTRFPGGHPQVRGRPAAFHGHGMIEQHEEVDILRYFQRVDEALASHWRGEAVPLVLAGGDDLVSIYREANDYPHIVEEDAINVNPDGLDLKDLHRRAWDIVQPRFEVTQKEAANAYQSLAGQESEQAAGDLATVVPAAYFERVDTIFVPVGVQVWGTFDPDSGDIDVVDEQSAEVRDLLDFAAVHTLFNGGTVYAVEPLEIPGGGDVAAILRY